MRAVIALVFLAAVFACVFTSGSVVRGYESMGAAGISDPSLLAVKFREALYGHAFATVLATIGLLLMMVNAFMQRARAKGIVIALFTLIAGVMAALAVLDAGAIADAAQIAQPQTLERFAAEEKSSHRMTLFRRMSLREFSPLTVGLIFATANMRVLTSLCLLSLGVSLTLIGGRAKPPAIPPSS